MHADRPEALQILDWYAAMGVDEAITPSPRDWFAESVAPLRNAAPQPRDRPGKTSAAPSAPSRPATIGASERTPVLFQNAGATGARDLAQSASTLAELRDLLTRFDGCPLKKTAKHLCFSRGSESSRVMFIGEAPGREEDLEGVPFVGRAGQLLDRMLAAIGLSESNAYITNVVYWRPPGNRAPTPQECQACQPFLERQIELVNPDVLVLLGGSAAKQVLNAAEGIMKLRGKWLTYDAGQHPRRAIATLHPAYLLRTPGAKRLAWRDLLAIQSALESA